MGQTLDKHLVLLSNDVFDVPEMIGFLESVHRNQTTRNKDTHFVYDKSLLEVISRHEKENNRRLLRLYKGTFDTIRAHYPIIEMKPNFFVDAKTIGSLNSKYPEHNLILITQNISLVERVRKMTDSPLSDSIYRLVGGNLEKWPMKKAAVHQKAFHIKNQERYVTTALDVEIKTVYSPKLGYFKLRDEALATGGEANLYRTSQGFLVKVFHEHHRRYETFKKLEKMIEMDIRNSNVIWPIDIVYVRNHPVGYIMKYLDNVEGLDMSRIYAFRNIEYRDRFIIVLQLSKLIRYLHARKIIIGDLKLDNIMIKKPHHVYLIDTGSFQIEDYACGVFNPEYTSDEMRKRDLRDTLRSEEDEKFAFYKIIFEIMVGKSPFYNPKSGETGADIERNFCFPKDIKTRTGNTEDPMFIWQNLDQRIRNYFYNYFVEDITISLDEWIQLIEEILKSKETKQ